MSKYYVTRQQLKLGTDKSECIGGGEERRGEEREGEGRGREKVNSNWAQLLGVEKCCERTLAFGIASYFLCSCTPSRPVQLM